MPSHKEKHKKHKGHENDDDDDPGTELFVQASPSELLAAPSDFTHIFHEPSAVLTNERPLPDNSSFTNERSTSENSSPSDNESNGTNPSQPMQNQAYETTSNESPQSLPKAEIVSDSASNQSSPEATETPPTNSPPISDNPHKHHMSKKYLSKTDKISETKRRINGEMIVVKRVQTTTERIYDENNNLVSEKRCEPVVLLDRTAEFVKRIVPSPNIQEQSPPSDSSSIQSSPEAYVPSTNSPPREVHERNVQINSSEIHDAEPITQGKTIHSEKKTHHHETHHTKANLSLSVPETTRTHEFSAPQRYSSKEGSRTDTSTSVTVSPPTTNRVHESHNTTHHTSSLPTPQRYSSKERTNANTSPIVTTTETIRVQEDHYETHKPPTPKPRKYSSKERTSAGTSPPVLVGAPETIHAHERSPTPRRHSSRERHPLHQGAFDLQSYLTAVGTGNVIFTDPWSGERVKPPSHPDRHKK